MVQVIISVDKQANTLTSLGGCVLLRHHQAAAFLAALVQGAECTGRPAEKHLSLVAMTAVWNDYSGTCEPDRTAIQQLLQSVNAGLAAVRSASQVLSLPRKATVGGHGGWRLLLVSSGASRFLSQIKYGDRLLGKNEAQQVCSLLLNKLWARPGPKWSQIPAN